jgi:hypothetical protein
VCEDFAYLGVWNDRLFAVDTYLVPVGCAYGWKWNGAGGSINIPSVSVSRLGWALFRAGTPCGLRDLVRHEYAHALADLYPRLSRSRSFRQVFGGSYDLGRPVDAYDPRLHVSEYAATQPAEDFAECFMYFVKHRSRLPAHFDHPGIRRRWRFLCGLVREIARRQGGP